MKASLFSILAAATLLASTPSFAATPAAGPYDNYRSDHDHDGRNDRNSRDFNYGYDRNHRVSPQERARWEAAQRHNDRRDARDDHFDRNQNYGFDRDHRVTPQERARWEEAQRHNGRR